MEAMTASFSAPTLVAASNVALAASLTISAVASGSAPLAEAN